MGRMPAWHTVGASLVALCVAAGTAAADNTWSMLEGRWSGVGTIRLNGGAAEALKCQATYRAVGEGHVAQRLTCVSASYRIDGSADLIFDDDRLSGTWSERSYSVGGGLSGSASDGQIAFRLDAPTFIGDATIKVDRCRQTIRVKLEGTIIESIDAGLRRC